MGFVVRGGSPESRHTIEAANADWEISVDLERVQALHTFARSASRLL